MARRRLWRAGPVPAVPAGGWEGTGWRLVPQLRPRSIGVGQYRPVRGVPLQPANTQAPVGGWAAASGTLTSPPAPFSLVAQTAVIIPGTYTVQWTVTLAGTVGAAETNNFILNLGPSIFLAASVNAGAAGTYPQAPVTFTTPGGLRLLILSGAGAATAGSVYGGSFAAAGVAQVQLGPAGLGNIWYPTTITVATSTGITTGTDSSICNVYLGPQVSPATLMGTVFGGNGVVAAALPDIQPGEFLIAQWAGAKAGDTAAMNVQGSMDALA